MLTINILYIGRFCAKGSLEPNKVKGKIVYCKFRTWSTEAVVKAVGGIGTIVGYDEFQDSPETFMAPATFVNRSTGQIIPIIYNLQGKKHGILCSLKLATN